MPSEQERRQAWYKLAEQLGKRYLPPAVSFTTYTCPHPQSGQREVLSRCRSLADRLDTVVKAGESLVWYGSRGTGKDHLMACLLQAAAKKHAFDCRFIAGADLFMVFRDAMDRQSSEAKLVREFSTATILAVSDPIKPQGERGPWRAELLAQIIDARYRDLRPTWITINAANEKEVEELLGRTTWDRLIHRGHAFRCYWPSYREEDRNGAQTP
jgi:DNA replication protein DnaC